jgi:hypothetical protein
VSTFVPYADDKAIATVFTQELAAAMNPPIPSGTSDSRQTMDKSSAVPVIEKKVPCDRPGRNAGVHVEAANDERIRRGSRRAKVG